MKNFWKAWRIGIKWTVFICIGGAVEIWLLNNHPVVIIWFAWICLVAFLFIVLPYAIGRDKIIRER